MKQVHWQLPFARLDGKRYRIDIYKEGAPVGGIKTLIGAESPFITEEDNSQEFFTSLRSHTGSITVIDSDGSLMESLLPSSNVDSPVRLVNAETGRIEWQGFVSCEAYTQSYTSRPQELTIHVNSVLAAMSSVRIELSNDIQFNTIAAFLFYAMKMMEDKAGVGELFDNVHISYDYLDMLSNTYIFNNAFFEEKTIVNGENKTYEYNGDSLKDVLSEISAFCGCVIRESARDIYMEECNIDSKYFRLTWEQAKQAISAPIPTGIPSESSEKGRMSDLVWMGDGHTKTVVSGARSVSVSSKVDKYGTISSLPSIPYGNLSVYTPMLGEKRVYSLINTNEQIDNRVTCYAYSARYVMTKSQQQAGVWIWDNVTLTVGGQLPNTPYADSVLAKGSSLPIIQKYSAANSTGVSTGIDQTLFVGSYFAKAEIYSGEEKQYHDTTDLLVISGCCTDDGRRKSYAENTNPLFVMRSTNTFSAIGGWLNIKASLDFIRGNGYYGVSSSDEIKMCFGLKFGNLFWDGTQWVEQSSASIPRFQITFQNGSVKTNKTDEMQTDEKEGWFVPLSSDLRSGDVSLYIFYEMSGCSSWYALINSLTVEYTPVRNNEKNDESANEYSRNLGEAFQEDKSVSLKIASDAKNNVSPTILRNSIGETIGRTVIGDSYEHPEEHLVEMMGAYYCKPRRILSLEAKIDGKKMPMLQLKGFDGRTYKPLSESKNWKTGKSTIQCFEVPEED